jgi:hypothetical protein
MDPTYGLVPHFISEIALYALRLQAERPDDCRARYGCDVPYNDSAVVSGVVSVKFVRSLVSSFSVFNLIFEATKCTGVSPSTMVSRTPVVMPTTP